MKKNIHLIFIFVLFNLCSKAQQINLNDSIINYSFKTIQDKNISISNFKGSILLVEFWASWDIPSREHHAELIKIYQNYIDKKFKTARRFNIISISLDINPRHLKLALTKGGIPWQNIVCDYKGWDSPWVDAFKIKIIPQNFLLDANSKIVATNVWYNELEKQLKALQ